jgi:hypothetical protein
VTLMPVWQVALAINLALAVALGVGYAGWGRRADALERELTAAQGRAERLERQRAACATGARADEQQWNGRGIVRAAYPRLLVVTHDEIRGLLPARTTSFPVSRSPRAPLQVGEAIRFALRGTALDDVSVVAVEPW